MLSIKDLYVNYGGINAYPFVVLVNTDVFANADVPVK